MMFSLEKEYELFKEIGLSVGEGFFQSDISNVPILEEVNLLLQAIDEKGLSLTQRGMLPTALVEAIVKSFPSNRTKRYLHLHKRFLEEEHIAAQRAKNVCMAGKLIKKQKNRLFLTRKGKEYLLANEHEKMIFLFNSFLGLNIGYYDRYQECNLINNISTAMLQLLRDKSSMFRTPFIYCNLFESDFPQVLDDVHTNLEFEGVGESDLYELFSKMVNIRLFQNFYLPFGFIEEQGGALNNAPVEYKKSQLLDSFLEPVNKIDDNLLLDAKLLGSFVKRIKEQALEIDLFNDLTYLFTAYTFELFPPSELLAANFTKSKMLLGTVKDNQELFYFQLSQSVKETVLFFSELEAKGQSQEKMVRYKSMIDGVYSLLKSDKPFNMFIQMKVLTDHLFGLLENGFKIDVKSPKFLDHCTNRFNESVTEDISHLILLMRKLENDSKKVKKIKPQIVELAKEIIHSYILVILELRAYSVDNN